MPSSAVHSFTDLDEYAASTRATTIDLTVMIKKAFDANGIKFAFPTVQIAGDREPSAAAVAHRALELAQPAAA